MTIAAIVLDFGNVVGFFDHGRATHRLAAYTRMQRDHFHFLLHEGPLATEFELGRVSAEAFRDQVTRDAELTCDGALFDEAYGDIFWTNPAVCDLVPELAKKHPLYLLSNTNALHSRQFLKQFAPTLRHFRSLLMSHEVGAAKPDSAIYEHAGRTIDRPAGDLLFVDDMEPNIVAARSHGWQGIVYNGGDLREQLAAHNVHV